MNNKKTIGIVAALVIVAGIGFYFYKNQGIVSTTTSTQDPNSADAQAEMRNLVAAVGELIDLPQGENPTVATITDPAKLKDQPFFANAKTGDKVLIYPTARKAFLYDPARNKLIEVAPLILGDPSRLDDTSASTPATTSREE